MQADAGVARDAAGLRRLANYLAAGTGTTARDRRKRW